VKIKYSYLEEQFKDYAKSIITLPVHQHLEEDIDYMVEKIRNFYG